MTYNVPAISFVTIELSPRHAGIHLVFSRSCTGKNLSYPCGARPHRERSIGIRVALPLELAPRSGDPRDNVGIGEVGLVGGTYTLNASIVDVETAKVTASAEYTYTGAIDNLLNRGMPRIVDTLLYGKTVSKKKWYYVIGGIVLIAGVTAGIIGSNKNGVGEKTGSISYSIPVPPD